MFIIIAAISLILVSNAFGQEQRRKSVPKTTIKKTTSVLSEERNPNSFHIHVNPIRNSRTQDVIKPRVDRKPNSIGLVDNENIQNDIRVDKVKNTQDLVSLSSDISTGRATSKTQKSTSRTQPPQPKGMNKADLTEQLSIKSPRDVATGQAKPLKGNSLSDTVTNKRKPKAIAGCCQGYSQKNSNDRKKTK